MEPLNVSLALNIPELSLYFEQVEQALVAAAASAVPSIQAPITRLIQAGGKRLRPSLIIAIVISQGKEIDDKIVAGCVAVELLHLASLVHDDVLDDADSRHDAPTVNRREGLNSALIVGNHLLARAFEQAASAGQDVTRTVATAFAGMCDGEARELGDRHNVNRSMDSYLAAINGKTAALFSAACRIGGLCTELPPAHVQALARYGKKFGMAYQITDDVLDFIAAPELSGKPAGRDMHNGVYTLPLLLAPAGPRGKAGVSIPTVVDMLWQDGSLRQAIHMAYGYTRAAVAALKGRSGMASSGLVQLPDTYLDWALKNLAAEPYRSALER